MERTSQDKGITYAKAPGKEEFDVVQEQQEDSGGYTEGESGRR